MCSALFRGRFIIPTEEGIGIQVLVFEEQQQVSFLRFLVLMGNSVGAPFWQVWERRTQPS